MFCQVKWVENFCSNSSFIFSLAVISSAFFVCLMVKSSIRMMLSRVGMCWWSKVAQLPSPTNRSRASEWLMMWCILSDLNSCRMGTAMAL